MSQKASLIAVVIAAFLSGCSPAAQAFTPVPVSTQAPTLTETPSPSPTVTLTPTATPLADLGIIVHVVEKDIEGAKIKSIEINGVTRDASKITSADLVSFVEAVPSEWIAQQESMAGYEVLIEPLPTYMETCNYSEGIGITKARVDVKVTITNLKEGRKIADKQFAVDLQPYCPAVINSTSNSLLALGLPNIIEVRHWMIETILANTKLPLPAMRVNSVAFSPDGSLLAIGSEDYHVKLWDIGTKKVTSILKGHGYEVNKIAISPDGSMLVSVSGREQSAFLWKVPTGEILFDFPKTGIFNQTAAFSPDGKILALSDGSRQFSGSKFWDMENIGNSIGNAPSASMIVFSPDGKRFALSDGTIARVLDVNPLNIIFEQSESLLYKAVSFSPDGKLFAIVYERNVTRIIFLNTDDWQETLSLEIEETIEEVGFSPDGRSFAVQSSTGVTLFDPSTGEVIQSFNGAEITSFAFSPDGEFLAAGNRAGTIAFWDVNTGEIAFELKNVFTP